MIDLTGQHIIVTGGEPTFLKGIITRLQAGGAQVTVIHHDKAIEEHLSCDTHIVNWHELDRFGDLLARWDAIHGVVICPSFFRVGRFIASSEQDWDEALQTNYEAAVYISQAVVHHMINQSIQGSIVFISTVSAQMPFVDRSITGTTLAMLRPLAKMAAVDCGQYGIRTHTLAIGWVESESTQAYLTTAGRAYIEDGIPLQSIGEPEAIGDVCCFLMSNLSRYMTGSVITVDGGYTLTRSDGQSPFPQ